jgi:hypothetical protein
MNGPVDRGFTTRIAVCLDRQNFTRLHRRRTSSLLPSCFVIAIYLFTTVGLYTKALHTVPSRSLPIALQAVTIDPLSNSTRSQNNNTPCVPSHHR